MSPSWINALLIVVVVVITDFVPSAEQIDSDDANEFIRPDSDDLFEPDLDLDSYLAIQGANWF